MAMEACGTEGQWSVRAVAYRWESFVRKIGQSCLEDPEGGAEAAWGFPRMHWCGSEACAPSQSPGLRTVSAALSPMLGTWGEGRRPGQNESSQNPTMGRWPSGR